jgi:hypothetical protein
MKKAFVAIIAVSWVVIIALGIILMLATPRDWPITSGSIKIEKVVIDQKPFVKIDGEGMNYLGQFQLINVDLDDSRKRISITRCIIFKNPFSKIILSDGWPTFCPLEGAKPGKYSVVYKTDKGEETAGTVDVP